MDQSNPKNYLEGEHQYFSKAERYFASSSGTFNEKIHAFPRFVSRQALSYFLVRNEIYREVVKTHGSIFDFGVYRGGSFFTWQQLGAIYEPYNHIRKVIGFDSFLGFSEVGDHDIGTEGQDLFLKKKGGMAYHGASELSDGIRLQDLNRPLGHVQKGILIKGELPESCIMYLDKHQETVIAMANFGLGLYEPTIRLLEAIRHRLLKGSILVFEDLNQPTWPGESKALREFFSPGEISLHRTNYSPHISWAIVGK